MLSLSEWRLGSRFIPYTLYLGELRLPFFGSDSVMNCMRLILVGLVVIFSFRAHAQPVYYVKTKNFPVGSVNGKLATEVGFQPMSVAANTSYAYISTSSAEIFQVSLATGLIQSLDGPAGAKLAIDQAGTLYAASGNRIEKRNSTTGVWSTVAGGSAPGFSGDGGNASLATLNDPGPIAFDAAGNIFFVDKGNLRIRRIDAVTNVITTIAGTGVGGYNGDGIAATAAQLTVADLALDATGNIYLTDGSRIRKISASSGLISTIAGDGVVGDSGNGGLAVNARVFDTGAIVVGSNGDIYFAQHVDMKLNSSIRKIRSSDGIIELVGGNDDRYPDLAPTLAANTPFSYTLSMDINAAGKIFICDGEVALVRGLDTTTGLVSTVAGNFNNYFCCDGGPADNSRFNMFDSRVGPAGEMVFIERFRIRKISATGTISTLAGTGHPSTVGGEGNNVLASSVNFGNISDLAFDHSGNLYFSETDTPPAQFSRLRKIDALTGTVQTIAGNGSLSYGGDGGPALSAGLFCDKLAVDPNNNPHFIDRESNGNMRIRKVDITTGTITTVAGGGMGGDGGLALDANMGICRDIAFDAAGNLFIAQDYRIRKVDVATGILSTIAGDGTSGFSGDGGPAVAARFGRLRSIEFDSHGNLFIGDWQNLRLRVIDNSGKVNTVAGMGGGALTSADGEVLALEAVLSPANFTVGQDTIYIYGDARIHKVYKDKPPQTITFPALSSTKVGSPKMKLNATSSSGLPVSYESSDATIATISDGWVNILGAGTAIITARQAGNGDFRPASKSQTLSVGKGTQLIYFPPLPPKFSTDPSISLSAFSTSTLPISYSSSDLSVATISGNTLTIVGAGTTTITASQAGDTNYNAAPAVTQTLVVHPSTQEVNFLPITAKKFGDAQFELYASSTSGFPISFASSNSNVISISGSIASVMGAGSVTIAASHAGDQNHPPAVTTQTISVAKADQVITIFFDGTSPRNAGEGPFDPSAFATSGLPVTYTSSNSLVASVEGTMITPLAFGEATITVSQPGNENVNPAPTQTFTLQAYPRSPYSFTRQFGKYEEDLHFSFPRGMATDDEGHVYVACSQENKVKKFNRNGELIQTIGSRGGSDGLFSSPYDVDVLGNEVFVLDRLNGRIQVFSTSGVFKRRFGRLGTGAGQFQGASGIAVSPNGHVYVADTGNNRIVVFSKEGRFLFSFGTFGTKLSQFVSLGGVALDSDGNVYVLDKGNYRVQVFNSEGIFLRTFGKQGSNDGEFFFLPISVDVNGNDEVLLLVRKQNSDHVIYRYNDNGIYLGEIPLLLSIESAYYPQFNYIHANGNSIFVSDPFNYYIDHYHNGQFNKRFGESTGRQLKSIVGGVANDQAGNIYVSSGGNVGFGKVKVLTPAGNFIREFGTTGPNEEKVNEPGRLVVDNSGKSFVVDQTDRAILVYDANGAYSRTIGSEGTGEGQFDYPQGIALDASGKLYVADPNANRVQVFDASGAYLSQFSSAGGGDGQFDHPTAVFIDDAGKIYVTDWSRTHVFSSSGNFLLDIDVGGSTVQVSSDGRIFVGTDQNLIRVFDKLGTYLYNVGSYGANGNGGFYGANYFFVDETNNQIVVAEFSGNVQVFGIPAMQVRQTELLSSGSTFDFGSVVFGSQLEKTFTLKNTGSGLLKLGATPAPIGGADSDYLVSGWIPGITLAPGQEASFAITFKPTASGARAASIELPTNAIAGGTFSILLNGSGLKAAQTISFDPLPKKIFNDPSFALTGTSSSGLPVTYTSSDVTIASVQNDIVTPHKPGVVTITASQSGNNLYQEASSVSQPLTVEKASQQITFSDLTNKTFGDDVFQLSATSSANLPITYGSSDVSVATIAGNTVTIKGAGTATITASQPGDTYFTTAVDVDQILTVTKAQQSISFEPLQAKVLGASDFSLLANASSDLAVQFTADDKITINGSVVKLVKAGRTTIKANQPGDKNYEPAMEVAQAFCINPPRPTITTTDAVLSSSGDSGNMWYLNGQPIEDANQKQLTAKADGTYTVRVQVDDCVSQSSDPVVLVITGDLENSKAVELNFYPNPVDDTVVFEITGEEEVPITYSILDLVGRTMASGKATTNKELSLNLAEWKAGTYFLKVQTSNQVYSKQFVKR